MIASAIGFVYRGQDKRLNELDTVITTTKATLKTQAKTVAVVPRFLAQIAEMRKRYRNFNRRLPARQELGGFLRDISAHLGDEEFSDQLIEPGSPTREDLFHTLPIIMRFRGSYLTSVDFFKRIDEMERLTRIQKLKMTRLLDKDDSKLEIELQLNIYFSES
jgi:type IV pilus assembly protein PilO